MCERRKRAWCGGRLAPQKEKKAGAVPMAVNVFVVYTPPGWRQGGWEGKRGGNALMRQGGKCCICAVRQAFDNWRFLFQLWLCAWKGGGGWMGRRRPAAAVRAGRGQAQRLRKREKESVRADAERQRRSGGIIASRERSGGATGGPPAKDQWQDSGGRGPAYIEAANTPPPAPVGTNQNSNNKEEKKDQASEQQDGGGGRGLLVTWGWGWGFGMGSIALHRL